MTMSRLHHMLRPPNVAEERAFEKANVSARLQRYLRTNPLDRFAIDEPYRRKVQLTERHLGTPGGFILDIGGNTAGEATILQQHGYRMVVGDINEIALDISRQRAEIFGLQKPGYVALDAHQLPFRDASFSGVMVLEALHHFVDYGRVLADIHRVLKPGGRLVSVEPNSLDPFRRASEVRDRCRGTIEKSFSAANLSELCERAGFARVRVEPFANGKSSWKLEEVPAYRRPVARLHGWLSEQWPVVFGAHSLVAEKAGELGREESDTDWCELLRSPVNLEPVRFAPELQRWVERNAGGSFPDYNGIPVLVAADRRAVVGAFAGAG
jgi:SAM-dependent methyltransferase